MQGLTDREQECIRKLGEAADLLVEIVGDARTREHDLNEIFARIHDVQARVGAQAAARAHPEMYRLLGGTLFSEDDLLESFYD
jgi:hypothetical protein